MTTYKIVEFEDGKFGVQVEEKYLFGLYTNISYLSRNIEGNTWTEPDKVEFIVK